MRTYRRTVLVAGTSLALLIILVTVLSSPKFEMPGLMAATFYRLGQWTSGTRLMPPLMQLGGWAQDRHLKNAIQSGRLKVVSFHDTNAIGMGAFSSRVFEYANSNGLKIVMVRLAVPREDTYEVIVSGAAKDTIETFIRSKDWKRGRTETPPTPFE